MGILFQRRHLGDCLLLIKNGANIKQDKGTGGIPITRIETLSGGVFNRDRLGYAGIDQPGKYESFILESGDLLFSHINSKAYIGRTVLYQKEGSEVIIHGMNLLRIKVIPELLIPKYLYYTTLTEGFKSQVASSRKDAVNQSSISVSDIKRIIIPVPSLIEQQRIVDELDLLTGIIDKKNAQLRDLDALAQSIFYEMFGDPITNDKGWPKRMLKQLGLVITGNTPSTKDVKNYASEDVCFFKPSDICKDSVSFLKKSEFHISSYAFEKSRKLPKGSVLTTCIGIVGKVGILTDSATCNQQINAIIPENVESPWLAYAVFLQKKLMEEIANAPVVPIINKGDFSRIQVPVPPIEKQEQFSQALKEIECQKQMILLSKSETEKLLSCRMASYFG